MYSTGKTGRLSRRLCCAEVEGLRHRHAAGKRGGVTRGGEGRLEVGANIQTNTTTELMAEFSFWDTS